MTTKTESLRTQVANIISPGAARHEITLCLAALTAVEGSKKESGDG